MNITQQIVKIIFDLFNSECVNSLYLELSVLYGAPLLLSFLLLLLFALLPVG